MSKKKTPVPIDDTDLDKVSGGLPAVQKVREAAATTDSSADTSADSFVAFDPQFRGGVSVGS
jgi:hypothetical protein